MTVSIPIDLLKRPVWTLTDYDTKVPLDPDRIAYGMKGGFNIHSNLFPLDTLHEYISKSLKPSPRLRSFDPYIFIDIEPPKDGSDVLKHPFANWPYLYLEYSKHHGLHGILPFKSKELQDLVIYKDVKYNTEFIHKNHFVTFTGNEIPVSKNPSHFDYEKYILAKLKEQKENTVELKIDNITTSWSDYFKKDLTDQQINLLSHVAFKKWNAFQNDDMSRREASFLASCANHILRKQSTLTSNELAFLVWKVAEKLMPYRKKHYMTAHYSLIGFATYRQYSVVRASMLVWNTMHDK